MTDPELSDVLRRAADLLPDTPDRLTGVRRKRTARTRRRAAGLAGVVALLGAGTAYGLTLNGTKPKTDVLTTASGSPSTPGDLTATGRVVQVPGKSPRFCADGFSTGMLVTPKPAPAYCDLGVDVRGVDFATLKDRYEKDGAVEGYATLVGRLEGEVLVVTKQSTPEPDAFPPNLDPPCPAPPGGWPATSNPDTGPMSAYQSQHPDLVAQVAIIRPTDNLAYTFVLTWGDPAPARSDLGPGVCVLQSKVAKVDFDAATRDVSDRGFTRANGVYSFGGSSLAPDGQIYAGLQAVRTTPALEALVAKYPAGTVRIDYWLHAV